MMQDLALAFEKSHPGSVVEVQWERTFKTAELVANGEADLGVAGDEAQGLRATPVAWDGLAVIVNFANPIQSFTMDQLKGIFSGAIQSWAELGGAEVKIEVIHRPHDRNLRSGLEKVLGVPNTSRTARTIRSDQKVLSAVGGELAAISYLSWGPATEALQFGVPVRIALIESIEPAEPTVKSGQYRLRRPVLLLHRPDAHAVREQFLAFVRSPAGQKIVDESYVPYSE